VFAPFFSGRIPTSSDANAPKPIAATLDSASNARQPSPRPVSTLQYVLTDHHATVIGRHDRIESFVRRFSRKI
jgi:hypothetical protein